MALGIAKYNSCIGTIEGAYIGFKQMRRIKFKGEEKDVMMCQYLMESLITAMRVQRGEYIKANNMRSNDYGYAGWVNQFNAGFCSTIQNRLFEMCEERQDEADYQGGNALVVVSGRMAAVEEHFCEIQQSETTRGRATRYGSGRAAGRAAGERANLGRPLGGGAPRGRLK